MSRAGTQKFLEISLHRFASFYAGLISFFRMESPGAQKNPHLCGFLSVPVKASYWLRRLVFGPDRRAFVRLTARKQTLDPKDAITRVPEGRKNERALSAAFDQAARQ
jgi:hypothetical protein